MILMLKLTFYSYFLCSLQSNFIEFEYLFNQQISLRESIQVPLSTFQKILNRPMTKFYNRDDVNVITAELRLTKTRPTSFYKKYNLL